MSNEHQLAALNVKLASVASKPPKRSQLFVRSKYANVRSAIVKKVGAKMQNVSSATARTDVPRCEHGNVFETFWVGVRIRMQAVGHRLCLCIALTEVFATTVMRD